MGNVFAVTQKAFKGINTQSRELLGEWIESYGHIKIYYTIVVKFIYS